MYEVFERIESLNATNLNLQWAKRQRDDVNDRSNVLQFRDLHCVRFWVNIIVAKSCLDLCRFSIQLLGCCAFCTCFWSLKLLFLWIHVTFSMDWKLFLCQWCILIAKRVRNSQLSEKLACFSKFFLFCRLIFSRFCLGARVSFVAAR